MRIRRDDFTLHKQNGEAGKDEPCLLTRFAQLDSPLGDFTVPIEHKTVPIHFPEGLGHGDLHWQRRELPHRQRHVATNPVARRGAWQGGAAAHLRAGAPPSRFSAARRCGLLCHADPCVRRGSGRAFARADLG